MSVAKAHAVFGIIPLAHSQVHSALKNHHEHVAVQSLPESKIQLNEEFDHVL